MLIRLGLVEQRHKAVLEVLGGQTVTDVARRHGVTRQTVHRWLTSYARAGHGGLVDHPSRPDRCPHQMPPVVEARIVDLRRSHPLWGPRTIRHQLVRDGGVSIEPGAGHIRHLFPLKTSPGWTSPSLAPP